MAYGNTYNNNQAQQKNNQPNVDVYANYRMNNAESNIDATCITYRYWKSNLCIGIFPRKNTGNDDVAFDMDNGITIYLSHSKARILKNELEHFLEDPVKYNGVGVPSGQAVISISNGAEFGKNTPVFTIRKMNENGETVASFSYEFHTNFHYSIRNFDGKNFDKEYDEYNTLEIKQVITLLDEYCKAVTNAVAFTVMEQRKYSAARIENKIEALAAGLNIDLPKGGASQQRKYNGTSYFDQNNGRNGVSAQNSGYAGNVSYGSASLDDLE